MKLNKTYSNFARNNPEVINFSKIEKEHILRLIKNSQMKIRAGTPYSVCYGYVFGIAAVAGITLLYPDVDIINKMVVISASCSAGVVTGTHKYFKKNFSNRLELWQKYKIEMQKDDTFRFAKQRHR